MNENTISSLVQEFLETGNETSQIHIPENGAILAIEMEWPIRNYLVKNQIPVSVQLKYGKLYFKKM